MTLLSLPWLELSIVLALAGSLWVSTQREPGRAARLGMTFTALAFACTFLAWLGFYLGITTEDIRPYSAQPRLFGGMVLALDELSAPLVPAVALLHFLTASTTARA